METIPLNNIKRTLLILSPSKLNYKAAKIHVRQSVKYLSKRSYPMLYYNDDCKMYVPKRELSTMDTILTTLYEHHKTHKHLDKKGIRFGDLQVKTNANPRILAAGLYKLCPCFISVRGLRSRIRGHSGARYFWINENGIAVLKEWEKQKNADVSKDN